MSERVNADAVIAGLLDAIGPLIGETAARVAIVNRMVMENEKHPTIAAELRAEAERLGRLADAAAFAVSQAHEPYGNGAARIPVLNTSVEVRP